MRTVNRFESNLLHILRCFMGQNEVDAILPILVKPLPRPRCLSRSSIELVQQSLSSGTVMLLTRAGAWAQASHLRSGEISQGSLWRRSKPEELGLTFSPASLEFLIWLTATDSHKQLPGFVQHPNRLTVGDQFLLYRAVLTLRDTTLVNPWFASPLVRENALIGLTLPQYFAETRNQPKPNFDDWMTDSAVTVLEAMQDELARAWLRLERNKWNISSRELMQHLGSAQEKVLASFFDAIERHNRRDLCRFVLEAVTSLMRNEPNREQWIHSLDTTGLRLSERTKVYRSASSFLRATKRLSRWNDESRQVGFFDEGYAESQIWKSMWESLESERAITHANQVLQRLSF